MSEADLTASLPTALFDYDLPPELIAQEPAEPRDASRLLVLNRQSRTIDHTHFSEIGEWLRPGDLLVLNRSRVVPARISGRRLPGGGAVEILLLRRQGPGLWEALVRPGRRLAPGTSVEIGDGLTADMVDRTSSGGRVVRFSGTDVGADEIDAAVLACGSLPLPPYIRGYTGDPERYQTIYGDRPGSAAAPTAGLHFTDRLLERLRAQGVQTATVTLHVGLDTFRPVASDDMLAHEIHSELCEVTVETVAAVRCARARGGRVVAVGTTTVRTLETAAQHAPERSIAPWLGDTSLFIVPGYQFWVVDAMITNFHLPRSTLLALVSAFSSRELILRAYQEAIERRYRFFSFGDAMLIL